MHSQGINGEGELWEQPANPGSPGKWLLKRSVCVSLSVVPLQHISHPYPHTDTHSSCGWLNAVCVHYCSNLPGRCSTSRVQPGQLIVQDPSMPLLSRPDPATQLEEARRRLQQQTTITAPPKSMWVNCCYCIAGSVLLCGRILLPSVATFHTC